MNSNDLNTIVIPLKGVESEHCALIVDKGVSKLNGIQEHKVELNNQRLLIKADVPTRLKEVVSEIRDLGYDVQSVKRTYPVLNMTCASCAVSAESMVSSVHGVLNASVNFANASLNVEYLPNITGSSEFKKALQSIGYDLIAEEGESQSQTFESIKKKQRSELKTKAIWAIALSLPVFIIGMFFMDIPYANQIMFLFTTPVVILLGRDFFINAWKQAKHRSANMDTLVAISTGIAYLFSVFNMLFEDFWHARGIHPHVYFEASSIVIAFILLGKLLEENSKDSTSAAIRKLIGMQPKKLLIIDKDGNEKEIRIEDVKIDDIILVRPGDKIAVDGIVVDGMSYVDESTLTGEPIAVLKKENDKVFAGSINQKGSFRFKALKVGDATMLAQIIKMIQDAQGSKAPVQKLVDKIAGIFVPVVLLIAVLTFMLWYILGGDNSLSEAVMASVTVLVIACPCALGLATPTAIMVGIGKAAENGILIKDAESIEKASKIDTLVLDKTGTITEGKPGVTQVQWFNSNNQIRSVLYTLEKHSEHPLAEAIVEHLKGTSLLELKDIESISGNGIRASYNNKFYYAGNQSLMKNYHIELTDEASKLALKWGQLAKTVVYFSDDRKVLAMLAIEDKLKPGSVEAISNIKNMGIEVVMLTGDNVYTAQAIATEAGIDQFKAEVLPHSKSAFISELQKQGKVVAMAGDGINDSAALAQADVSIAMGKGSDIAIDVAKMTIVSSDLNKIPQAVTLSKNTVATIRQNLFWAFIYNVIGIPLAAGVLYPLNGFLLNPMIAGAAMALSSVSVVGNSLRLNFKSPGSKNYKIKQK